MGQKRLGSHQKKARNLRAFLAFVDESGLLLAPLLRRSWAERGHRPIFPQQGKKKEKVSVAAAILVSPRFENLEIFYKTLVNEYFDNFYSALFLEALLKDLGKSKVIVVWDGGPIHQGDSIRQLQQIHKGRLFFERLPPYAPKLNPVEPLWSWLKYGRLCNFAAHSGSELDQKIKSELEPILKDQHLIHALWHESELPMPQVLLF